MALQESFYFLRQFGRDIAKVGAILPTSAVAGRAMASEFARRHGKRRILEVGAGTGAISAEIIRQMRDGDELVLCELNADFVAYLQERLERDPLFVERRPQITLLQMDVTKIDRRERFDFIISGIPFTNCPPDVVKSIFDCYREILKPDGVLSFIEYAYLRTLKQLFLTPAARRKVEQVNRVVTDVVDQHLFRLDFVGRNLPPAWVRHLRFEPPEAEEALTLAPLTHNRRIPLGKEAGISTDALPFLGGLLGMALLLRPLPASPALIGLLAAGVVAFFRDPIRSVHPEPSVAYAAADGRVLSVERMFDQRFGAEKWLRIAVFLSITDVHINRSPVAGKVVNILTQRGGFAIASSEAAEENHAEYTVIEGHFGRCVVAQRVGIVARRIVNWAQMGILLAQGERYGLMRFGSRTDVYLPAHLFEPCVAVGDSVVGGMTVLARLKEERELEDRARIYRN